MIYLSAENIAKAYADKELFAGLSFGIDQGQKIALIGINGSGKSTLLKIVAGIESPDSGRITVRNGIRVAFLPQEPDLPLEATVSEVVFASDLPAVKLIDEYERLSGRVADEPALQGRLTELMSEIEAQNAWEYERRIHEILSKLDVDFLDRRIGALSGGQRKRVALAQALIGDPDLLVMDEPTNHLDLDSIEWLEKFLSTSKQSLLLVTHDRYFLDSITNEIFELEQGLLFRYQGNYAYFLEKKAEREQQQTSETDKARSLFRRELEWLRRSPKARGTKSKSRIDSAHALGEKARYQAPEAQVQLDVKGRRIGGKTLEIKNLQKAYGDLKIVDGFSYTFGRRDRVGIVGPNGVGKTTFLRMITGEEAPDYGKLRTGETIVYGHYRQDGLSFKDNARMIEVVTEAAEMVELSKSQTVSAAQLLEHFLFPRHTHYNRVETLSGGEKRRLHLLRVLMTNPNFLILDEPTNDLDLVTLQRLEEFLYAFEGCLLVVTHDRYFMDRLVEHLFVFEGEGHIRDFPGSYSQYRDWQDQQQAEKTEPLPAEPAATAPKSKPTPPRARKLSYNEQREFQQLEAAVEALETRKAELTALINGGSSDYEQLSRWSEVLDNLQAELEAKSDRWLELAAIAEGE